MKRRENKANGVALKRVIVVILLMIIKIHQLSAQKYERKVPVKVGGGLELFTSGNWHGTLYSPSLSLNKGRNMFYGGALIQKRSSQVVGGRFGYSFNLSDPKGSLDYDEGNQEEDYQQEPVQECKSLLHLNFFSYVQYINNGGLSYVAARTEQLTHRDGTTNWNSVKLNTAEVCLGFELNVRFSERITWKNFIGGSVYYHINYVQGMYHERVAPTLVIGTGIHICPL